MQANEDLKTGASAGRSGGGGKSKLGSAMQDRPMYSEVCSQIPYSSIIIFASFLHVMNRYANM